MLLCTASRVARLESVGTTNPGATQLTRMPRGPNSAAKWRLKPTRADLAVA